jgi:hypothetical protein
MRTGVWDYVIKRDKDDRGFAEQAVDSAVEKLQQLDLRETIKRKVFDEWLPSNFHVLQRDYPGQVVALWHEPEVRVVAAGEDAFAMYGALKEWREEHKVWEAPQFLRIPAKEGS